MRGLLDKVAVRKIDLMMQRQDVEAQIKERQTLLDEAIERNNAKEEIVKELRQQHDSSGATDATPVPEEEILTMEQEINSTIGNQILSLRSIVAALTDLSSSDALAMENRDAPVRHRSFSTQTGLTEADYKELNPGAQDIRSSKDSLSK